jgi:starch phosphorylase
MTAQPTAPPAAPASLGDAIGHHLKYTLAKAAPEVSRRDLFQASALAVRDRVVERMLAAEERYTRADAKRLYYLSLEFLMGRSLGNNLANLGIEHEFREALADLGADPDAVLEGEPDAALGNGGLGRLAACFLDSLATLDLPGFGYGINYDYGLFRQEFQDGRQKEKPDNWLAHGTPWEVARPDEAIVVPVYGRVEHARDREGNYNPMWLDWQVIIGVPYDMPVVGYGGSTVNYLRLFTARSSQDFDMQIFNDGDYLKAVEQKIYSETVSKVLYPSDTRQAGRELRLVQEYFLVACSLRDIVRRYQRTHATFEQFPDKVAMQLNDTHPALAVAELMRLLVDENNLGWDEAWDITKATVAYTNHTLMPEALEKISVPLMEKVVPRHLEIIYEINRRFLENVDAVWPGSAAHQRSLSLIEEGEPKQVRMAHLAMAGSHSINGVAALHTHLLETQLFPDFHRLWPEKFNNKTNGVTQRRWLLKANPGLAELLTRSVGDGWVTDLDRLRGLEPYADDKGFQEEFLKVKRANKERLARLIKNTGLVVVDPDSLFDIQVKRIHEYKRQLLNCLQIIHEYLALVEDGREPAHPKTYVFGGKAAPGYWAAKQIIKLINDVGRAINHDRRAEGRLKVVFVPDYRVSLAEIIIPAADLSEQISTAGKEASGTGNMKFAMNGALTIGTLDGANIEIMEEVGPENIFIFGLKAAEVEQMRREGSYDPREYYRRSPAVRRVLDALRSDRFCPREPGLHRWLYDRLLGRGEEYFHAADLDSYIEAQRKAGQTFVTRPAWARKAVLNVARMGKFSSDRTIRAYADEIWGLTPVPAAEA